MNRGMRCHKFLHLPHQFEPSHFSLFYPRGFMRLLSPIIEILISDMDGVRGNFAVGNWIATQFVGNDLPGLSLITTNEALEETLGSSPIPLLLQADINNLAILIHGPPRIMLLTIYSDKDLVDVEGIPVSTMTSLQCSSV